MRWQREGGARRTRTQAPLSGQNSPSPRLLLPWDLTTAILSPAYFLFVQWNAGALLGNPGVFLWPMDSTKRTASNFSHIHYQQGLRPQAALVSCHCPGPRTQGLINPVLLTSNHLWGTDLCMAVILIIQTVDAKNKNLMTSVLDEFRSSKFLPSVDSLWNGGDSLKVCELITGWVSLRSERSQLRSDTWVRSYDHSLTNILI